MKAIVITLMSIVVLLQQLSLSSATAISAAEAEEIQSSDKRFELYKFIFVNFYKQKSRQLVINALAHGKILQEFDSLLKTHSKEPQYNEQIHAELKLEIQEIQKLSQNLHNDLTNCELKQNLTNYLASSVRKHVFDDNEDIRFPEYNIYLRKFCKLFPEAVAEQLSNVQDINIRREMRRKVKAIREEAIQELSEADQRFSRDFYDKLYATVERFMASLSESEKEKYAKVLKWSQGLLSAETSEDAYNGFSAFYHKRMPLVYGDGANAIRNWDEETISGFYDIDFSRFKSKQILIIHY